MYYRITNAAVTLKGNTILEEINLDINDGEKIAIVGKNGSGKTTLLKALIDNSILEEGIGEEPFNIEKQGNFKIGYLSQISFNETNNSLIDEVLSVFNRNEILREQITKIENEMITDNSLNLINKYHKLKEEFQMLGGHEYRKRCEVIINKFGFKEEDKYKKIGKFSGGEVTKIALMKLLLSKPDLLILDEPTNHLDINTIEWLEDYLYNYKSSIILVSHDRMFLDKIVNVVYDIDYGRVVKYYGNYTKFEIEKNLNYENQLKNYELQQKEIKRLENIYFRFRYKPTKAKMALSKLKQIEKMDIISSPRKENKKFFHYSFSNVLESGYEVLKLKKLNVGYDKSLFEFNFIITKKDKIGIIGANGIGKSTLLKTLAGIIFPIKGKFVYGTNVKIGYFDQQFSFLDDNITVLEDFCKSNKDVDIKEARNILGTFLFSGEDVNKKISILSGGEKVRLQLCKILVLNPNFLILDEPTNHLDILGKSTLEEILKEYKGSLIVVSHDRYFINKVCNKLIVLDDSVEYYNGNYEYYLKNRNNKEKYITKKLEKEPKEKKEIKKDFIKELTKEIKNLEKSIEKKEKEIENLLNELNKEEVYTNYLISRDIEETLEEANIDLDDLNYLWEKKSLELEKLIRE